MSVLEESAPQRDVSVVIPTYNEAENVVDIVDACLKELFTAGYSAEVIVVDDDSPDETWKVARAGFETNDRVRVIRRTDDRGLGGAVLRGFEAAAAPICAVIDADFQHPPAKLPEFVHAFHATDVDDIDLVIGSRYADGGGIAGWSSARQAISHGATLLARLAAPRTWQLSDPMSGFFAVRRDLVFDVEIDTRAIHSPLDPNGYKILLEILTKTRPRRVIEVPFVFRERRAGESKLTVRETGRYLVHCVEIGLADVETKAIGRCTMAFAVLFLGLLTTSAAAPSVSALLSLVGGVWILGIAGAWGWRIGLEAASLDVDRSPEVAPS